MLNVDGHIIIITMSAMAMVLMGKLIHFDAFAWISNTCKINKLFWINYMIYWTAIEREFNISEWSVDFQFSSGKLLIRMIYSNQLVYELAKNTW